MIIKEEYSMKHASRFERVAARMWNILNEGKPFTPVFVLGMLILFYWHDLASIDFWIDLIYSTLLSLPIFIIYYIYDFPLHLRKFLWLPFLIGLYVFTPAPFGLYVLAIAMYFFFTVIFWGTIYYHLRIGTPWTNYRRFWRLVLKNSDSTSGNAQEQLPKVLLLLGAMTYFHEGLTSFGTHILFDSGLFFVIYAVFLVILLTYSYLTHYYLFRWKPAELPFTQDYPATAGQPPQASKVFIVIIDGCRKDRLAEADTPFIDRMCQEGTEFTQMETVYPDRTVVCFSSLFTGAYPREHGIKSNMVWRHGVRTESMFDSLRKVNKIGRLLGIAHLVDAFGNDVETVTAVMKNDLADGNIMRRARRIMEQQNPDVLIVQLIATDQTGHSQGALYDEYKQKIEEADKHTELFYHWLEQKGWMEDAVFIVAADHGQSDGIGGHGHLDEGERYVPFIMMGKGIHAGVKVDAPHSLVSVTPTVCALMQAPLPDHSHGPILSEAWQQTMHHKK
jgi:hypothetical protein